MPRAARSSRHPLSLLLACLALAMAALGLQPGTASGSPPAPVRIVVDAISSSVAAPVGTPSGAVPYVLVEKGQSFFVDVSFYDADGQPAAFNKDTTLTIGTNTGSGNAPAPGTGTAPKGATTARLVTSLPLAANQVQVTVGVAGSQGSRTVAPGTSTPAQAFDVLEDIQLHASASGQAFAQGIGGDGDCAAATIDRPVCGVLLLPNGARSPQVLLSLGACDASYGNCLSGRGAVVQALADLEGLYSKSAPATLILTCDKSLCGQGPLQDTVPSYSLLGNTPLRPTPPCPAKATIGADQEVCVDYVSSNRDNAGDSLLHILLDRDARVSVR